MLYFQFELTLKPVLRSLASCCCLFVFIFLFRQVFKIEVLTSGRQHTVEKRYSEFHALHKMVSFFIFTQECTVPLYFLYLPCSLVVFRWKHLRSSAHKVSSKQHVFRGGCFWDVGFWFRDNVDEKYSSDEFLTFHGFILIVWHIMYHSRFYMALWPCWKNTTHTTTNHQLTITIIGIH